MSGEGATAALIPADTARRGRPVAASGIAGRVGFAAAIFAASRSDRCDRAGIRSGGMIRV